MKRKSFRPAAGPPRGYRRRHGIPAAHPLDGSRWEVLAGRARRATPGKRFQFGGELTAEVIECLPEGRRIVEFAYDGVFEEILDRVGLMPLPPYIHEKLDDRERYQTVYARVMGSAAAPTAGLHFTPELLDQIGEMGVDIVRVTLHVGLGTFRPVKTEHIEQHVMHAEYCEVDGDTARRCNQARNRADASCAWARPRCGRWSLRPTRRGWCGRSADGPICSFIPIPVPGRRRAGHQFPYARILAAHDGQRVGRTGGNPRHIPSGRGGAVPVFQLRRRDADIVVRGTVPLEPPASGSGVIRSVSGLDFQFEVIKTCAGTAARLGRLRTPHGDIDTPVFMPVGNPGHRQGDDARGARGAGRVHRAGQYLSPVSAAGTRADRPGRGTAPLHALGPPHPDRQRRFPGIQPERIAAHPRRGRGVPVPIWTAPGM